MGHVPMLLRSSYATEEQRHMVCRPPNPPPEVERGNVHRLRRSFQYAVDAVTKQGLNAPQAQEIATKTESAARSLTGWYQQGSGGGVGSLLGVDIRHCLGNEISLPMSFSGGRFEPLTISSTLAELVTEERKGMVGRPLSSPPGPHGTLSEGGKSMCYSPATSPPELQRVHAPMPLRSSYTTVCTVPSPHGPRGTLPEERKSMAYSPPTSPKGPRGTLPEERKSMAYSPPTSPPGSRGTLSEDAEVHLAKAELARQIKAKNAEEEETHIQVHIGQALAPDSFFQQGRYVVRRFLGKGVYAKVFECQDLGRKGSLVAIKVFRAHPAYTQACFDEVKVMQTLDGACGLPRFCGGFRHLGHVGFVAELYGENLKTMLERVGTFTLEKVADVGLQVLDGIKYMHQRGLVHGDLKPDNLVTYHRAGPGVESDDQPLIVRIVDLGAAELANTSPRQLRGTPEYCAPEVVLKVRWSYEVDLWSIGCILVELATSIKLFGEYLESNVHLMLMQKRLGRELPQNLLRQAMPANLKLQEVSLPLLVPGAVDGQGHQRIQINPTMTNALQRMFLGEGTYVFSDKVFRSNPVFQDLLNKLLDFEADKRGTAAFMRGHPFFQVCWSQEVNCF